MSNVCNIIIRNVCCILYINNRYAEAKVVGRSTMAEFAVQSLKFSGANAHFSFTAKPKPPSVADSAEMTTDSSSGSSSSSSSSSSRTPEVVVGTDNYVKRTVKPLFDIIRLSCYGRSRQRRKLVHAFEEWAFLQTEAYARCDLKIIDLSISLYTRSFRVFVFLCAYVIRLFIDVSFFLYVFFN